MAQQKKKRPAVRRAKSAARSKARKASKSARGKASKSAVAKPTMRKPSAMAKPRLARRKKIVRKNAAPTNPLVAASIETVTADVVEERVPGVITVAELEETEMRGPNVGLEQSERDQDFTASAGPDQPGESQNLEQRKESLDAAAGNIAEAAE